MRPLSGDQVPAEGVYPRMGPRASMVGFQRVSQFRGGLTV